MKILLLYLRVQTTSTCKIPRDGTADVYTVISEVQDLSTGGERQWFNQHSLDILKFPS